MTGIYFLIKDNVVVYVGQSTDVQRRITKHRYTGKQFDSFRIIPCPKNLLLHYEKRWIKRFNPIHNRPTGGHRPGSGRKKGEDKVRMWIPISLVAEVKKII